MLDVYLKEVLAAYEVKRDEGNLSQNLLHPTPGRLRDECLIVYRERSTPQDDSILRLFFSYTDKDKGYTKGIENFRVDDFRQIPKILDRKVTTPGVKYIDLLAWLIDFNPRPSTLYYKAHRSNTGANPGTPQQNGEEPAKSNQSNIPNAPIPDTAQEETGQEPDNNQNRNDDKETQPEIRQSKLNVSVVVICMVLLFTGTGAFLLWDYFKNTIRMPSSDEKCMYWTGDHYEPIKCDEKIINVPILPLNIKKLTLFKKINSFDTLTKNAIGKVWYSSIGGQHEFFTDSGMHPVDTVKRLRPLTSYILTKHVSYYRYQLMILTRSISLIIVLITAAILMKYVRRKHKFRSLS